MCTAVCYKQFFGRNLDYEFSYGQSVIFTPRNYHLSQRIPEGGFALLGVAHLSEGTPLYYDAVNEHGLAMAGLSFPHFAVYPSGNGEPVPSWELIPWVLRQCKTADEGAFLLRRTQISADSFSPKLQPTPLHWILADKSKAYTVEPLESGLAVTDNPVGVLSNSPPFDFQMLNLATHMGLSPLEGENRFTEDGVLKTYSRGLGAVGLPGDSSSASRFVRAAFTALTSQSEKSEDDLVQMFHILSNVSQIQGCVRLSEDELEKTIYTAVCDLKNLIYYTTTYEDFMPSAVNFANENPDSDNLVSYPISHRTKISYPSREEI